MLWPRRSPQSKSTWPGGEPLNPRRTPTAAGVGPTIRVPCRWTTSWRDAGQGSGGMERKEPLPSRLGPDWRPGKIIPYPAGGGCSIEQSLRRAPSVRFKSYDRPRSPSVASIEVSSEQASGGPRLRSSRVRGGSTRLPARIQAKRRRERPFVRSGPCQSLQLGQPFRAVEGRAPMTPPQPTERQGANGTQWRSKCRVSRVPPLRS